MRKNVGKITHQYRGYILGLSVLCIAVVIIGYFMSTRVTTASARPQAIRDTVTVVTAYGLTQLDVRRSLPGLRRDPTSSQGNVYRFPRVQDEPWTTWSLSQPVSVAFLDSSGAVLRLVDMEPCILAEAKNCPAYEPNVAYRMVIEVQRDWFKKQGLKIGDFIQAQASSRQ
jgi:uncharacterized protein